MSNITVKSNGRPSAAQVRAWGRENDFEGKTEKSVAEGVRGRLNPALVTAFNAGRKGSHRYDSTKPATKGTTVTVKPEKGRSKTVTYSPVEARKALAAQGIDVKPVGRLPKAALASLILNG